MAKDPQLRCSPVARGRFRGLLATWPPNPAGLEELYLAVEVSWGKGFSDKVLVPLSCRDVEALRDFFTKEEKP